MFRSNRPALLLAAAIALLAVSVIGVRPAPATHADDGHRIGYVDSIRLIQAFADVEPYRSARENLRDDYTSRIQQIEANGERLNAELRSLQPGDLDIPDLQQELTQLSSEWQQLRQEGATAAEDLAAQQLVEIFERVRVATGEVAQAEGYHTVLSTKTDYESLEPKTITELTQEFLSSTALVFPEGDNVTEQVAAQLGLDLAAIEAERTTPAGEAGGQAEGDDAEE